MASFLYNEFGEIVDAISLEPYRNYNLLEIEVFNLNGDALK